MHIFSPTATDSDMDSDMDSDIGVRVGVSPVRIDEVMWEIPRSARGDMRASAVICADDVLMARMRGERSIQQLQNVATLPGVMDPVVGLPDMHEGYGFPVGGVAAMRVEDGVVSPGGIGFDINCGVRLLATRLNRAQHGPLIEPLLHELSRSIPSGFGRTSTFALNDEMMDDVLVRGAQAMVHGHACGHAHDLDRTELHGCMPGADPRLVSRRARERGARQLGTLGGGNHFLELQAVDVVLDENAAEALGLSLGQITVMLHTGSRGLGHQICTEHVKTMDEAMDALGIVIPDRQLACAPILSPPGQAYLASMAAAANFAWANRQVLTHRVRGVLARIFRDTTDATAEVVYDVAHNIATFEKHQGRMVCVHRKGATRALGPSSELVPVRGVGQPVFIPGSMGTASYVLVGEDSAAPVWWASCCHGAGRTMSRHAAKRAVLGHELRRDLQARGVVVRCPSNAELAEEAPVAYKDIDRVIDVVSRAGMARPVARLVPLGVLKG